MIWDVGVPSRGLAGCSTMPVPNPSCFVMTAQKDRYKAPKTDYSFFPWDLLICLKGRVIERWTERERSIHWQTPQHGCNGQDWPNKTWDRGLIWVSHMGGSDPCFRVIFHCSSHAISRELDRSGVAGTRHSAQMEASVAGGGLAHCLTTWAP